MWGGALGTVVDISMDPLYWVCGVAMAERSQPTVGFSRNRIFDPRRCSLVCPRRRCGGRHPAAQTIRSSIYYAS